jgi:hypothetical protein
VYLTCENDTVLIFWWGGKTEKERKREQENKIKLTGRGRGRK